MSTSDSSQFCIRQFCATDLDDIVDLWNQCLPKDPITVDRFWRLYLLDPNFQSDGAWVATHADRLCGFALATHSKGQTGYLAAIFVDASERRKGIGERLLGRTMSYLRLVGCQWMSVNGYGPLYSFPGVDVEYVEAIRFFESQGFLETSRPVSMEMSLEDLSLLESARLRKIELESSGFQFRTFARSDTLPVLEFMESTFPYWKDSVLSAIQRQPENLFLAIHDSRIKGFAQWENNLTDPPDGALGRFGPFGVDASERSNGIGAALFLTVAQEAKRRGRDNLWFGWAGGRNLSFYQRVGCRVTREFRMFRKEIA